MDENKQKKFEENSIDRLIQELGSNNKNVRSDSAWKLGEVKDESAIESFIIALRDRFEENSIDRLIRELGSNNKDVRSDAAWKLGEVKDKRGVEALIIALRDRSTDVRWSAALALGEIGDERAADPLSKATKDTDVDVRKAAREALGEIEVRRGKMHLSIEETALVIATRIFQSSMMCGDYFRKEYKRLEKKRIKNSTLWEIFFEFHCLFYWFATRWARRILSDKDFSRFAKFFQRFNAEGTIEAIGNNGYQREKVTLSKNFIDMLDNALKYYDRYEDNFIDENNCIKDKVFLDISKRLSLVESSGNGDFYSSLVRTIGKRSLENLQFPELLKTQR